MPQGWKVWTVANGRNSKKKGIAASGTWVPLPLDFLRSRACAELSPHGAKLLLDLLALLGPNAGRNGDLSLSPKTMAVRGWSGRATLGAAVHELLEHGILVQTHQGSRLDCSLFALTLFPLDCDPKKIDVGPGCYTHREFEKSGLSPPTDDKKAKWRQARKEKPKTILLTPPRYEVEGKRTATVRTHVFQGVRILSSYRGGTKPPVLPDSTVPPRVTF